MRVWNYVQLANVDTSVVQIVQLVFESRDPLEAEDEVRVREHGLESEVVVKNQLELLVRLQEHHARGVLLLEQVRVLKILDLLSVEYHAVLVRVEVKLWQRVLRHLNLRLLLELLERLFQLKSCVL